MSSKFGRSSLPEELLEKTRAVETRLNTMKKIPKGPRVIDIDILTYHLQTSKSENS